MGLSVSTKSGKAASQTSAAAHQSAAHVNATQPERTPQPALDSSNQGSLRLSSGDIVQRECACGGVCPQCRAMALGGARVSQPDDPLEREADHVADRVMRMPEPLRAQDVGAGSAGAVADAGRAETSSTSSRAGGQALPASVRSYFEPRFGRDFGGVRVHDGPEAAGLAQSLDAHAFTVGRDIYFGRGAYAPDASDGRHRIAHELTHVVQQQAVGRPKASTSAPSWGAPQVSAVDGSRGTVQRQAVLKYAPPDLPCNLAPNVEPPAGTEIQFTVASWALSKAERARIDAFAGSWSSGDVLVAGYASKEGPQGFNWRLACSRAQSVAKRLMGKGVPADNIHLWAHGETTAFAAKSLPPNRRAVISKVAVPPRAAGPAGKKGAPAGKKATAPSAAGMFGLWRFQQTVTDGTVTPKGAGNAKYESDVEITFSPETKTVECDQIAFVQTVRLMDKATMTSPEPRANFQNRMTKTGWTVDRLDRRKYGWYGFNNNGKPSTTVRPGSSPKPRADAWMSDTPGWNRPDMIWDFEACAICKRGTQANQIYGSLTWGFDVDAKNKLTKHRPMEFARPSAEFMTAAKQWNVQAAGPKGKRNAPDQVRLGPFK